ncbi:MAG: ABC transporter substrate-binding protein [Hyphomicrobiaceae bacterium]
MKWVRVGLCSAVALAAFVAAAPLEAKTFKFSFQGSLKNLDMYSLNETFTLGMLNNVYEGLVVRDNDLRIQPALAERWEIVEPTRWRIYLRKGVKFHNGNDFTADDVIFSADRVRAEGSDLRTRIPADAKFEKVDDHTVDVVLSAPNPILMAEWETWGIMDKEWTEANDAVKVTSASDTTVNYAALNANGTGPYKIVSHQPDVKTVFEVNPNWWGKQVGNVRRVEFTPIGSDATRVAALLSGELDMVFPIPVQDQARVDANAKTRVLAGPELRTIFLGMDQRRDELLESNVKGQNPFKDVRVRKAFYQAIDIEAIKDKVMRGQATPTALMISPILFPPGEAIARHPYDPAAAKALLTEAGYPNGFEVGMDCPNDRYVNDEAICQAVVAFLARIGVKVNLNAQVKGKYFAKVLASGGYNTSFYLLGWTPGSSDSWNVLLNLHGCRDDAGKGGPFNLGGYCNPSVDALAAKILVENDQSKRDAMILEAYKIIHEDVAHLPLHQQALSWGVSNQIEMSQRADNVFYFKDVIVK